MRASATEHAVGGPTCGPIPGPGPEDILTNLNQRAASAKTKVEAMKEKAFEGKTVKTLQPAPAARAWRWWSGE